MERHDQTQRLKWALAISAGYFFAELIGGRTAILISHRFSTVRMADRIVVLQNGTITEEGTHEELAHNGGLYAELFDMQASGYR